MNKAQLEARVLEIADRVQKAVAARSAKTTAAGQEAERSGWRKGPRAREEDSFVELKNKWVEPTDMARQLAGQCNAARGEDVLWIVGLCETGGLVGVDGVELANQWPQIEAEFDGIAPRLETDLIVPVGAEGKKLLVLYFSTDRAPFVVKNPKRGQPGAGPFDLEVPWREGTRIRSARREDLLRLLVQRTRTPQLQVLRGSIIPLFPGDSWQIYRRNQRSVQSNRFRIAIDLYITPADDAQLVFPDHLREVSIKLLAPVQTDMSAHVASHVDDMPAVTSDVQTYDGNSELVRRTLNELIVTGPGKIHMVFEATLERKIQFAEAVTRPPTQIRVRLGEARQRVEAAVDETMLMDFE